MDEMEGFHIGGMQKAKAGSDSVILKFHLHLLDFFFVCQPFRLESQ